MESKGIMDIQKFFEKEQSESTHASCFQNLLQSHSNQISVALT